MHTQYSSCWHWNEQSQSETLRRGEYIENFLDKDSMICSDCKDEKS